MTSFPIPFHQLTCTCGHSACLYTAVTCAALRLLTALSACVSTVSMRTTSSISCAPTYSTGSGVFLSSIPLSPLAHKTRAPMASCYHRGSIFSIYVLLIFHQVPSLHYPYGLSKFFLKCQVLLQLHAVILCLLPSYKHEVFHL